MTQSADERLILMLEARVRDFERNMASAERRASRNYRDMRRGSQTATAAMEADMVRTSLRINQALATTSARIGAFGRAFAVGFGASLFAGVSTNLRAVIGSLADLADTADRLGVGIEDFQGLTAGLKLAGVETATTTAALEAFNDRLADAAKGQGELAEVLRKGGVALLDQQGNMRSTVDILRDYAELMAQAPDAITRMGLATDAFGRGGKALAGALAEGRAGVDQMISGARDAGLVLDEELIRKAGEIDDKWDVLTMRFSNFFKSGVVGAVELVEQVAGLYDELERVDSLFHNPDQARAILGGAVADALEGDRAALNAHAGEIAALRALYIGLAEDAASLEPELRRAAQALGGIGQAARAADLNALVGKLAELRERMIAGTVSADDFEREFGELIKKAGAAFDAVEAVDRPSFDRVIGEVDRLKAALAEAIGSALGLRAALPGGSWEIDPDTLPVTAPGGGRMVTDPRERSRLAGAYGLHGFTRSQAPARPVSHDRPGGGGGGGSGRLDALVAELQTEREVLTAWYAESLELLAGATDAELVALGGRSEAIERLEAEHMERLREIRAQGQGGILSDAGSFFGAMADAAAAGGDKMQRAARFFGALEGAANVGVAQTQVLRDPLLPWWKKIPAAMAIGAAGARVVASIKGGSAAGGGGGSGGGVPDIAPASAGAGPEAGPLRATVTGLDPKALFTGEMVMELFDSLQKEAGNRGLSVTWAGGRS